MNSKNVASCSSSPQAPSASEPRSAGSDFNSRGPQLTSTSRPRQFIPQTSGGKSSTWSPSDQGSNLEQVVAQLKSKVDANENALKSLGQMVDHDMGLMGQVVEGVLNATSIAAGIARQREILDNINEQISCKKGQGIDNSFQGPFNSEICEQRPVENDMQVNISNVKLTGNSSQDSIIAGPPLIRVKALVQQLKEEDKKIQKYLTERKAKLESIKNSTTSTTTNNVLSENKQEALVNHSHAVGSMISIEAEERFEKIFRVPPQELNVQQKLALKYARAAAQAKGKCEKAEMELKIAERKWNLDRGNEVLSHEYQKAVDEVTKTSHKIGDAKKLANEWEQKGLAEKDALYKENRLKNLSERLNDLQIEYDNAFREERAAKSVYDIKSNIWSKVLIKNADQDWKKYKHIMLSHSFLRELDFFKNYKNDPQIQEFKILSNPGKFIHRFDLMANGVESIGELMPPNYINMNEIDVIQTIAKPIDADPIDVDDIQFIATKGEIVNRNPIPADTFMREYLKASYAHKHSTYPVDSIREIRSLKSNLAVLKASDNIVESALTSGRLIPDIEEVAKEGNQALQKRIEENQAVFQNYSNYSKYQEYDKMSSEELISEFRTAIEEDYLMSAAKFKKNIATLEQHIENPLKEIKKLDLVIGSKLKCLEKKYKKDQKIYKEVTDRTELMTKFQSQHRTIQKDSNKKLAELRDQIVENMGDRFQTDAVLKKNIFAALDTYARGGDKVGLKMAMCNIYQEEKKKISENYKKHALKCQNLMKELKDVRKNPEKTLFIIVEPLSDPETIKDLVETKKQQVEKERKKIEEKLAVRESDKALLSGAAALEFNQESTEQKVVPPEEEIKNIPEQTSEEDWKQLRQDAYASLSDFEAKRCKLVEAGRKLMEAREEQAILQKAEKSTSESAPPLEEPSIDLEEPSIDLKEPSTEEDDRSSTDAWTEDSMEGTVEIPNFDSDSDEDSENEDEEEEGEALPNN